MYKIRPRRTRPQGILMLCMILMFMMLAINVIVYELTPQYSSFGSQRYVVSKSLILLYEIVHGVVAIPADSLFQ